MKSVCWRPIAPGDTSTIFLSAWDTNGNPVPISPVSFVALGSGDDLLVRLQTDRSVAGLQFRVEPRHRDGTHAWEVTFRGVINDLEGQGFTIFTSTDADGVTTILMLNSGGGWLPPGDHTLIELVYHIADRPDLFGTEIIVRVSDIILSDPNSQRIYPTAVWDGSIHIGRRGDLNATGDINVLDVIQEIKYVLGLLPIPINPFAFYLADVNGDGGLNILDIVRMINIILDRAPGKPITGPTGPVWMELGEWQTGEAGQSVIPLRAQFDGAVAGLQLRLTYDSAILTLGEPIPAASLADMTIESHAANGSVTLLVYSVDGHAFRAGTLSTLLSLPVTVHGGATAEGMLSLSQVVAADAQAQSIPVTLGASAVKVSALPTAFALKANRPNPFNPRTQITYGVPQPTHVTLAVYNLLGQEVIRLVDDVKAPGRYVVTWDGRNGQGVTVASGVYLYRLTTSTGFTQTRRMTLLK